ncbi:hypothetical protein [Nocardia jiangxiensis]|uniref:hypothetical protein n=1 Tax=Nocardia jiangxiensis TaxID=282685 RepID=UPI000592CA68|nr:hypothetical protein [Nocardia jiangxiensis]
MAKFKFAPEAKQFTAGMNTLLNGTICNNARLITQIDDGGQAQISLAGKINDPDDPRMNCVPLRIGNENPTLYVGVQINLQPDPSGEFLMVRSSVMMLAADPCGERELLHYDYERNKEHGYPEAHVQVKAASADWDVALAGRDKPLHKLHLPVGGRRFRPTLEDVIEFLIVEKLVKGRDGWEDVLEKSRQEFQEIQLRAAVRNYPKVAVKVLQRLGYEITEPSDDDKLI